MKTANEYLEYHDTDYQKAMIEFAKDHVDEALKAAFEKAELDLTNKYRACEISEKSIFDNGGYL